MDYAERFWANIEKILKQKNITWTELSRRIDVDRVSLVHTKQHHNLPRAERLKKLSEALGVTSDELINV